MEIFFLCVCLLKVFTIYDITTFIRPRSFKGICLQAGVICRLWVWIWIWLGRDGHKHRGHANLLGCHRFYTGDLERCV